jgi:hypothetical protein
MAPSLVYCPTVVWETGFNTWSTRKTAPANGRNYTLPLPIHRWDIETDQEVGRHKIPNTDDTILTGFGRGAVLISLEGTIVPPDHIVDDQSAAVFLLNEVKLLEAAFQGPTPIDVTMNNLPGYFTLYRYKGGILQEFWNLCRLNAGGFRQWRSDEFLFRLRWSADIISVNPIELTVAF